MKKLYPLLSVLFLIYWGCEEEVEEDTTPPTVSIQSPITNQTVNGIVNIIVETNDNEGINRVEFYINDSLSFTDTESPYQYDWNTLHYKEYSETIIKVISYDNSGNFTESQPVLVTVEDITPPTVSIQSPIMNQTVNDIVNIVVETNDNEGINRVEFYIDDSLSFTDTESPYQYDWNSLQYTIQFEDYSESTIKVISYDNSGNFTESQSILLTVDNRVYLWGELYIIKNTTELSLSSNELTGEIPSKIGNLINLTSLDLDNNELTGSIPSEMGNLTNLSYLNLGQNGLTGTIPTEVCNLINLTTLNLHYNELTGLIPSDISNLTNLTWLTFERNQLTGSIPLEIFNLTNLSYLNLGQNGLTGTIPTEVRNLVNLTTLNLHYNELTGSIPSDISNLTNLNYLNLGQNGLTGSIPSEIVNLTNLFHLNLGQNGLTGSIPSEIGDLGNLLTLYLSSNQLSGEIPESICDLYQTTLFLSNNQLCPPYPSCVEDYLGQQDTTNCD